MRQKAMDSSEQVFTYEFLAKNCEKIMLQFSANQIYDIVESRQHELKLCSTFPWLKIETVPIVSFSIAKFIDPSEALDKRYSIRMTAQAFARMVGIKFKAYEESMLKETLLHG